MVNGYGDCMINHLLPYLLDGETMGPHRPRWRTTLGYSFVISGVEFWNGEQWIDVGDWVTDFSLNVSVDSISDLRLVMPATDITGHGFGVSIGDNPRSQENPCPFRISPMPVSDYLRLQYQGRKEDGWETLDARICGQYPNNIVVCTEIDDVAIITPQLVEAQSLLSRAGTQYLGEHTHCLRHCV